MKLKCPHCKTAFQVDENEYAAIVEQVRTAEFETAVQNRVQERLVAFQAEQATKILQVEKVATERMSEKDGQIAALSTEIERLKGMVANNDAESKAAMAQVVETKTKEMAEFAAKKERQIAELTAQLKNIQTRHQLEIVNEQKGHKDELHVKDQAITELSLQLKAMEAANANKILELEEHHAALIKAKNEEIEHYRDLKSRMSTKMLGETLEQHCQIAFNQARSLGSFPGAYFDKDNDASSGSKGDFIFRDYVNGHECISIMFEMKTEADTTSTKHKNVDFFAKLDKDRNTKNCEYAVLVSTLEADNELYNNGIVDVSHDYPKMFVVRPQFFLPFIALLSKAAKKNAETMISLLTELDAAKSQSVEVTQFENRRDKFIGSFKKNVEEFMNKHESAIKALDTAISNMEKQVEALRKIKALFDGSTGKLGNAVDIIDKQFTIKKLCYGLKGLKAEFEAARKLPMLGGDNPLPQLPMPGLDEAKIV